MIEAYNRLHHLMQGHFEDRLTVDHIERVYDLKDHAWYARFRIAGSIGKPETYVQIIYRMDRSDFAYKLCGYGEYGTLKKFELLLEMLDTAT